MVTTTVRHIINLEKTIINRKTTDFTVNEEHFLKSSKDLKGISRGCMDDFTAFFVVVMLFLVQFVAKTVRYLCAYNFFGLTENNINHVEVFCEIMPMNFLKLLFLHLKLMIHIMLKGLYQFVI